MTIYNSEQLIQAVKLHHFMPTRSDTFTDEDILRFATELQLRTFIPKIRKYNEDHVTARTTIPLVAGQARYRLPGKLAQMSIRHIQWKDDQDSNYVVDLARANYYDLEHYRYGRNFARSYSYVLEGNFIHLLPDENVDGDGFLEIWYFIRPNKMVASSRVAQVDTVVDSTTIELVNNVSAITNTSKIDIISHESDCSIIEMELSKTQTGNIVTLDSEIETTRIKPGDWVTVHGETPVPNIMEDLHPLLVEYIVLQMAKSQGDSRTRGAILDELGKLDNEFGTMLEDRLTTDPVVLVNRNSILRRNRRNSWGVTTK